MAKAKQEEREWQPGGNDVLGVGCISGEDSPQNRHDLAIAMRSVAACVQSSGTDPFDLTGVRSVAEALSVPYLPLLLAYSLDHKHPLLSADDLDEWNAAAPWVRSAAVVTGRQLEAELKGGE